MQNGYTEPESSSCEKCDEELLHRQYIIEAIAQSKALAQDPNTPMFSLEEVWRRLEERYNI